MFIKLLGSCLILMLTCGVVQAQSMFDRCITAMDAKDTKEIEKWATMIKRSAFSEDNADKAIMCIEAAFGKGSADELLAKRDAVSKMAKATAKVACHRYKLGKIDELIEMQEQALESENTRLIAVLTYDACVDLNKSNPKQAILHPVCRDVFKANLHPDLDTTNGESFLAQLRDARTDNLNNLIKYQKIIDVAEGKDKADAGRVARILNQALKPCD